MTFRTAGVVSRLYHPGHVSGSTELTMMARSAHVVMVACTGLQFQFPGVQQGDINNPNAYTVKAAVETSGGQLYPLTFAGSATGTVTPGADLLSDQVPGLAVAAGDTLYLRCYITVNGGTIPLSQWADPAKGEGYLYPGTDLTTQTGALPSATGNVPSFRPCLAFGQTTSPHAVVATAGDSILFAAAGVSWIHQALIAASIPHYDVSLIGQGLDTYVARLATSVREQRVAHAGVVVTDLGVNNLRANVAGSVLSAMELRMHSVTLWRWWAARNQRVFHSTITPITNSTDSWATSANQTLNAAAGRVPFNNWLRAGGLVDHTGSQVSTGGSPSPNLTGVIEVADLVETARDSGLWKSPGITGDGLHPGAAGHTAMTPGIDTARFARRPARRRGHLIA